MKLDKTVSILISIALIINLGIQLLSILALTKSRIGKKIRKNVIGVMYDVFDESIDEAAIRAPQWMEKAKKLG